jgi:ATP-dependent DNA helicase RecQ
MAQIRPTDRPAFRRCHGVGERKLEEFGDTFLRTITAFLDGEGCPEE